MRPVHPATCDAPSARRMAAGATSARAHERSVPFFALALPLALLSVSGAVPLSSATLACASCTRPVRVSSVQARSPPVSDDEDEAEAFLLAKQPLNSKGERYKLTSKSRLLAYAKVAAEIGIRPHQW